MTAETFRRLALTMPQTQEWLVMGAQEFRTQNVTFATLGWPQAGWALVKLTPKDQARLMSGQFAMSPEPGGRGQRGVTRIKLEAASEDLLRQVLEAAWRLADGRA